MNSGKYALTKSPVNAAAKLLNPKARIAITKKMQKFALLSTFKFYKDDVGKKVKTLSGGERIRIRLASLLQQNVNCLVFDEPTNHIDIPTKEVLEKAIENFDGTVLFVSHDRYFINKFAEKTIEFENGNITSYEGNYDYFKQVKQRNSR